MRKDLIVVRTIGKNDISGAQGFLLQQCKDLYGREFGSRKNKDIWELEKTYVEPARNTMLGAFDHDGLVVGTIGVCVYNDRIARLKGRYNVETTAEVGRCYIDKQLRRQGIGSLLVKKINTFCIEHGYHTMYLHTHKFLPGGFVFWQNQGFTITIDESGSDETVHMEKSL